MTSSVHFSTMSTNQNDKEFMALIESQERCRQAWYDELAERKRQCAIISNFTYEARMRELARAQKGIWERHEEPDMPDIVYRCDQNGNYLFDNRKTMKRVYLKSETTKEMKYHMYREGNIEDRLKDIYNAYMKGKVERDIATLPKKQ